MSYKTFVGTVAVILIVIVLLVLLVSGWESLTIWYKWRGTIPDNGTRSYAANLDYLNVAWAEIYTPTPLDKTVVKDPAIIADLIKGLQTARIPDPVPLNRVDSMILILNNGKTVGPFGFSTDGETHAFSPMFVKGLRAAGVQVPRH